MDILHFQVVEPCTAFWVENRRDLYVADLTSADAKDVPNNSQLFIGVTHRSLLTSLREEDGNQIKIQHISKALIKFTKLFYCAYN